MDKAKRRCWKTSAVFVLLAAVMGALQWNWFAMPLERDEGEYAYAAWLMRTGKGVPYKDSFLQKPPMIVYTYALVEAMAPDSDKVGFRVAGFLAVLATAGLVWGIGRREFGGRTGTWTAWLWAAFVQQLMFAPVAANVEKFMVVPMLGAMAMAGRGERRWWRWAGAGALAGAAVLYKPICVPVLGVWFSWAVFAGERQRTGGTPPESPGARPTDALREALGRLGWVVLGGVVAAAAGVGWFAWKGALGAMWECAVEFTGAYAKVFGNPFAAGWIWFRLWGGWKVVAVLGLTAGGFAVRWRDGGIGWGAVSATAWLVAMGDSVGGHYYIMALPLAAIGAGAGIERFAEGFPRRERWAGAVCVAVVFAALMAGDEWRALRWTPAQLSDELYTGNPFVAAEGAGKLVGRLCGENGTVHVVGSEPEILWYARRKGTTRFDIAYPMTLPTRFAAGYQQESLRELTEKRPEIVVAVGTRLGFGAAEEVYRGYLQTMAEMILRNGYHLAWAHMPPDGKWVRGGIGGIPRGDGADMEIWCR